MGTSDSMGGSGANGVLVARRCIAHLGKRSLGSLRSDGLATLALTEGDDGAGITVALALGPCHPTLPQLAGEWTSCACARSL